MRIVIGILVAFFFVTCTAQKQKPAEAATASKPEESVSKVEEAAAKRAELIADELGDYAHFHIVLDTLRKISPEEGNWKEKLTKEAYHVLFEKGTERPYTGELLKNKQIGQYTCGACALPLFHSDHKFESGTGWPSFYKPIQDGHVAVEVDKSYGMSRVEVLCARCDGHLGHVFKDGPKPTRLRYCINSLSLGFIKD